MKTQPSAHPVRHLFSVDVEEHFQVNAFEPIVKREGWDTLPSRVVANTERLLDLLQSTGNTGTFFVLGWVAERQPALVRRIVADGHEVASHTWWHRKVSSGTADQFREEIRTSKQKLEQIGGVPVVGFRAPSFSIVPGTEWAFDVLLEEGYQYDSSLFPIRRPDYGYPGIPYRPYRIERAGGALMEFPMATLRVVGMRLPAAGGGYLRHFPPGLMRAALRQHEAAGLPAMLYIHPWEIDPEQPRLPVGWLTTVRHYRGLEQTFPRLREILGSRQFTSVAAWRATHPS